MPIGIRTEGLRKVYPAAQQRGDVVALDGLTLEVQMIQEGWGQEGWGRKGGVTPSFFGRSGSFSRKYLS
jgi:hypothetical protein